MNSKGHLYVSIAKSILRILGCVLSIVKARLDFICILFLLAEILGILEEIVDKR